MDKTKYLMVFLIGYIIILFSINLNVFINDQLHFLIYIIYFILILILFSSLLPSKKKGGSILYSLLLTCVLWTVINSLNIFYYTKKNRLTVYELSLKDINIKKKDNSVQLYYTFNGTVNIYAGKELLKYDITSKNKQYYKDHIKIKIYLKKGIWKSFIIVKPIKLFKR